MLYLGVIVVFIAFALFVVCAIAVIQPFKFQPLNSRKNAAISAGSVAGGGFLILCMIALTEVSLHPEKYPETPSATTTPKPVSIEQRLHDQDPSIEHVDYDADINLEQIRVRYQDVTPENNHMKDIISVIAKLARAEDAKRELGIEFRTDTVNGDVLFMYVVIKPETLAYMQLEKLTDHQIFDRIKVYQYTKDGRKGILNWCDSHRDEAVDICSDVLVTGATLKQ